MSSIFFSSIFQHRLMRDGDDTAYEESLQALSATDATQTDGDEVKWILFSSALLMSWCFLAIAATMGYYSWREDRLLRQYQLEGVLIPGQVSKIVLLREGIREIPCTNKIKKSEKTLTTINEERGDDGTASLSNSSGEKYESLRSDVPYSKSATYLVAIGYDVELAGGYSTGILKWVRLQGDVLPRSLFYRKKSSLIGMTLLLKSKFSLKLSNNENLLPSPTEQEKSSSNADTTLPLLLMKEFPLSAHPRSAIIKSRSLSSRFVSCFIVIFFTGFGALTHFLAIHIVCAELGCEVSPENLADRINLFHILFFAILSFVSSVTIFIVTAVRFLDEPIGLMLEGEYTKRGEYASKSSGQTYDYTENTLDIACRTMSSRSDVFLSTSDKKSVPF
ncbi:hypothetical protein ACHAWX_001911 [Stephanocyclus meneghinianus]